MSNLTSTTKNGYMAIKSGNIDAAEILFSEGLSVSKNNSHCLKGIAICKFHKKEYVEAISLFENLINLYPYDFSCRSHLLKTYNKLKDTLDHKTILDRDEKIILSNYYKVHNNREESFSILSDMQEELTAEEALDLAELTIWIREDDFDLQRRYLQLAIKKYEMARMNPYKLYYLLALSYYNEFDEDTICERYEEIFEHLKKSIKLEPSFNENYYYMATIYRIMNMPEKSLEYIAIAIEKSDEVKSYYYLEKARSLYDVGDYIGSLEVINYMNQHDYQGYSFAFAKYLAAYCHCKLKNFNSAVECANRARAEGHDSDEIDGALEYFEECREIEKQKKSGFFSKISKLFA